ncbi:alpha/beta hydrolase [Aeromicrobium sp. A1-2]|uniref:alpha/beta fold hydrolase n=1 Tax=Aeromicrobium sp. A1-2 TaxID=2107713 RepID=UPI000E4D5663|nr:alpha/beta hydrolase [Aeromicrobium sp. A1-2]AXT84191.1 alpha/beta hydrolase [Aeromicrobium sp. A1-2]
MSVPRSLDLPPGVEAHTVDRPDGDIAMLSARTRDARRGHILLIPGWTGSKEDFTPLLPLLANAGFDADAYDQPGQYESAPGADYSLESYARTALSLASTAGGRSHLMGHSFGGLVAQQAAALEPDSIATLSLLCSGPGALGDVATRPLQRMAAAIGKVPLLQLHQLREQGIKRPAQITAFLARRFTSNDPASLKAMTQLLIDAPDIIADVAATRLPVWVGRGADDDAWPHEVQDDMGQRLGTEVHVVQDSAHSPAVENPVGLLDGWLPFLQAHSTLHGPEVH